MLTIDQIRALHIELTTRCNARCPMCMRNYRGVEYNSGYPLTELKIQQVQQILDLNFLSQIDNINFNGNLGDFGLATDAFEIVQYLLKNSKANINIETNGSTRSPEWWAKLSNPRVRILFGIDGLEDTHKLYRLDTDWQKIINNSTEYIRAGGRAVWKFIPFDHNRHQIDDCKLLSEQLGFESFVIRDHGRDNGPVFSRKGEYSHFLGKKWEIVPLIQDMINDHQGWKSLDSLDSINWLDDRTQIDCYHKKQKEIYIAANGSVYPCCWLGFFPDQMNHPGNNQIKLLVKENNALEHGLEHAIRWFNLVETQWLNPSISQGKPYICVNTCGKSN